MNFFNWLMKQLKRDDVVGDLAQDTDRHFKSIDFLDLTPKAGFYKIKTAIGTRGYQREVRSALAEAWREYQTKYKGRRKQLVSAKLRFDIFFRDDFKCQLCNASIQDGARIEVDHKISVKDGGPTDKNNLWTLCFKCNRGKGKHSIIDQEASHDT